MSERRPGFMCENGEWVNYPDPLRGTYETPEALQAQRQASQKVVSQPEVYGERLVGLNQHYLNIFNGRPFRKKGRTR